MFKPRKLHSLSEDNTIAVTTIRELVLAWRSEELLPYENNRGLLGVSSNRVSKIVESFDSNGLGVFTMAKVKDKYQLADAHTRMESLDELADSLNTNILDKQVLLSIVPEAQLVPIYALLNDGKSHSGAMKISNPDYLLGNVGKRLMRQAGINISPTFQQNMWDVILSFLTQETDLTLCDVYRARRLVDNEYIDVPAGMGTKLPINKEQSDSVIKALKYYKEVMIQYDTHRPTSASSGKMQKDPYSIGGSPGLFITIVYDQLRSKPLLTDRSASRLAATIFNNASKVKEAASTVARRSSDKVNISAIFKSLSAFEKTTPDQRDDWKGE